MTQILTLKDALTQPWLLAFLEQTPHGYWRSNTVFQYENNTFIFKQPILARQRKDLTRGFAYEEIGLSKLGEGAYGIVYPVIHTLSKDKKGTFRIRDNQRVVKKTFNPGVIQTEYEAARHPKHLRAKKPNKGHMVMGKIKGVSLDQFLHSIDHQTFPVRKRLALMKALLQAYKKQVADIGLIHNDLHSGNMLINVEKNGEYQINIIDFGEARFRRGNQKNNLDLTDLLEYKLVGEELIHLDPRYPAVYQEFIKLLQTPVHSWDKSLISVDALIILINKVAEEVRLQDEIINLIASQINTINTLTQDAPEPELQKLIQLLEEAIQDGSNIGFKTCNIACDKYLINHSMELKFFSNKIDIFRELAVILACCIVLYPLAIGINYLKNDSLTFFGENKIKKGLETVQSSFQKMK